MTLLRRQEGLGPQVTARAWKAQTRLCGPFQRMAATKNNKSLVVAATPGGSPGSSGPR